MNEDDPVKELIRLGLSEYQSKVYSSLAALGPSGASEINRMSHVPRTKIYETLEELIAKGIVEFQPGRPIVYRAIKPELVIKAMTEEYLDSAKKAEKMLEERYEQVVNPGEDLVWTVHGDLTIRRKLAEIVVSAKESIFILESYPPFFIASIRSLLKTASRNGMRVRAVCVAKKEQLRAGGSYPETDLIEYRAISTRRRRVSSGNKEDESLMNALELAISGSYGLAIIDDVEAFVIIQNLTVGASSIGLSAKIPGVPILQRIMFERLFERRTTHYFSV
ncbi:MAG TPA: helix-turn-helix domain-containing protein [Nitrososphaerales archaeon]|nr:helix-turn-helix domain-containing protein [Nitrososphaerales archaeon]